MVILVEQIWTVIEGRISLALRVSAWAEHSCCGWHGLAFFSLACYGKKLTFFPSCCMGLWTTIKRLIYGTGLVDYNIRSLVLHIGRVAPAVGRRY